MEINDEIFRSYLNCKYKAYLKLSGDVGKKSDYENIQLEMEMQHKKEALERIISKYKRNETSYGHSLTSSILKEGKKVVTDLYIEAEGLRSCCCFEKASGKSRLGQFHYVPFIFTVKKMVSKEDKIIVAYSGLIISNLQSKQPEYGKIIYGSQRKSARIKLGPYIEKASNIICGLKEYLQKQKSSRLILNSHCKICEFKESCRSKALEKDDLSLLSGMTEKEILKQNKKGIFTVTQYSYTFRPRRKRRIGADSVRSTLFELKALAIRENKIYVYQKPQLSFADTKIYLDIEGNPDAGFNYLIGIVISVGEEEKYYSLWANDKNEETVIFQEFLHILSIYPDFTLFHYGAYETRFLKRMRRSIDKEYEPIIDKILKSSINILSVIYAHIYFPTYSNELKDIGSYLGLKWTAKDASGIQSIVWRRKWEIDKSAEIKEDLIKYNLEDCLALKYLTDLIYKISDRDALQENEKEYCNVVYTDDLKTDPNRKFKKVDYCFSDLEYVNQCAYFDYQREKVFIHTNKNIRRANRYYKKLSEQYYRVNKHIYLNTRDKCPRCGNKKPYRHHNCLKKVLDLKFSNYGAKRYITVYHTTRLRCIKCKNFFTPDYFRKIEKYGHGLISLIAYHHIATSQTFGRINEILTDLYGISLGRESLHRFKSLAAEYYKETYKKIINKLIKGSVIHVDETMVKIEREHRYVWVFTNMEEVVFMYTKTREGDFLKEFLAGFKGVLISDFYAAYNSMDCYQQKCLIHLIRDLNEDLLKNPFDQEYKQMVQHFSILLRDIVATVDKYGLKSRSLKKYKKNVDKYFSIIADKDYKSELAQKCQKRLLKNKDGLFTFLGFDGVPWNNNNAEHSIKHFAKYRHITDGCFTEQGISQYLLLLSIYQTCRYKGINFLKFLLSREKDIDEFNK